MKNELNVALKYTKRFLICDVSGMTNFDKYSPMYIFTNENITGIMNNVNFNEKEVLLVCSSGDHIFNALLYNPKRIVAYDINTLTKHMFELKRAAILELSNVEFLNFFFNSEFIKSKKCFNKKTYDKVKHNLPALSRVYWDYIFDNFSGYQICSSFLLVNNACSKKTIRNINPYLKEDNYLKLREKLRDFKLDFINDDINNLSKILDSKFDYIYLSNIISYLEKKTFLVKFKSLVLDLKNCLKENGQLGLVYLYNYKDDYFFDCNSELYNPIKRDEFLRDDNYDYFEFPSTIFQKDNISTRNVGYQNRDAVLALKK